MKFFFDESGDFRLDDDGIQRVGIVVGITIPESSEVKVFAKFDDFVATLSRSAFKKGEPKGRLLSSDERKQFARMLADNDSIVVTPAILDIPSIIRANKQVRSDMVRRMRELAKQCVHETMQEQAHLLANQFDNLSDNQSLRLGAIAYCIQQAFQQTIILLAGEEYSDCWQQLRFEIDPVGLRRGNREEQVFKWTMLGWLQGWSQRNPTMTITEIHTENHPLIRNYLTNDDKFDLNRIYIDNIHYPPSSQSKGIQIADMAASIVHRAVCGIVTFDDLMNYGLLLKNNLWNSRRAPGLFCFTDSSYVDWGRYEGLIEAVAKARGGEEWRQLVRRRLGD